MKGALVALMLGALVVGAFLGGLIVETIERILDALKMGPCP